MKRRLLVNLIKYGCCAVFVGLLVWAFMAMRDFSAALLLEKYRMLCDAFTIPGVVLLMIGSLVWVSNTGALDGISYCLRFMVFSLIPGKRLERDEKYGEYIERRMQNRVKGYGFLFWSGLATMAIALVFYALYYTQY